jgi:undecaprenyl-diphosphatase
MPLEQIIILAVIQGVTEFLPISSSGHLILVPVLTGWSDQGLLTDVMVHMGSFAAVIVYFWRDLWRLTIGGVTILRGRMTDDGRLALYILIATIPAVLFGIAVKTSGLIDNVRGAEIVAWNAIIFACIMFVGDHWGTMRRRVEDMKLAPAVLIGIAQAIAIIPGVSRSGITMTAARALGFTRPEAARFSFLLGVPAIAGAGVLVIGEAIDRGATITTDSVLTGFLTFFTALAAIAFLMKVLQRYSLNAFVIYRIGLGITLLVLIYRGTVPA